MNDLVLQLQFDRAHRAAILRDLVALVSRRPNHLASYHEVRRGGASGALSYRGVRAVPIDRIVGSVERVNDFDRAFLPRKRHSAARWRRVARAHIDGISLPPVQLYEVGGSYFVQDGHHRISVALRFGQQFIDAEITAATTKEPGDAASLPRPNSATRLARGLRSLVKVPGLSWRPQPQLAVPGAACPLDCPHCAAA
jgi:hypothetical protein